jgi:hypothetical protein
VSRGDFGHRGGAGQDGVHDVQAEAELAQRLDQVEPGRRFRIVEPVPGGGPGRGRDQARIGPEPDRPGRNAGAP